MYSRKPIPSRHAALALWVAGICVAAPAGGADQLQATFDRMDRAAASFKGLSAEVTKISHNALLNEDDSFTGSIAVRRGPKQRDLRAVVDILHPDPKKVLLTGHKVEMYYPKTNTKQIIDLDKKGSKMVDQFLLLGFGSASVEIRNATRWNSAGRKPWRAEDRAPGAHSQVPRRTGQIDQGGIVDLRHIGHRRATEVLGAGRRL